MSLFSNIRDKQLRMHHSRFLIFYFLGILQPKKIDFCQKCTLKVRSHQTRMTWIAQMIYMLTQCKDAKDNPAALFAWMRWHEWRELSIFFSRELKNLNFAGYSRRVNQSGACSSSDVITSGGRKSQTTMEDKVIVVVCGYPELYTFSYFYKNRNTFCNETGAA